MVFDPTQPPEGGSPPASAPIRENFIQLAVHHMGAAAPANASKGFVWWDTSTPTNEKLRGYNGSGWVSLFDHMESVPVPSSGGGGGGSVLTRGDVSGSFVPDGVGTKENVQIGGLPNNIIVVRLMVWGTPAAGGQFTGVATGSGMNVLIRSHDGSIGGLVGTPLLRDNIVWSANRLKTAAPFGQNYVHVEEISYLLNNGGAVALYDGTNLEWHTALYSEDATPGNPIDGSNIYLDGTVGKVGGYTTADYAIAAGIMSVRSYIDLENGGKMNLLLPRGGSADYRINYRLDYLHVS